MLSRRAGLSAIAGLSCYSSSTRSSRVLDNESKVIHGAKDRESKSPCASYRHTA